MTTISACMGGWCALRDYCPAYHAADRSFPSERLCPPGRDGRSEVIELHVLADAHQQLASSMTPADPQGEPA